MMLRTAINDCIIRVFYSLFNEDLIGRYIIVVYWLAAAHRLTESGRHNHPWNTIDHWYMYVCQMYIYAKVEYMHPKEIYWLLAWNIDGF